MYNRIIEFANALPSARSDRPFEGDFFTTVLRHSDTGKWFGLLISVPDKYYAGGGDGLNLKCPEELAHILTSEYSGIIPAYHMNKKLWITVMLDSDVPREEIFKLIRLSYDITAVKSKREENDENFNQYKRNE